jgi:hypothetical protein
MDAGDVRESIKLKSQSSSTTEPKQKANNEIQKPKPKI